MFGSYSSTASCTHDKFDVLCFQHRSDDAQHFGKLREYNCFFGSLRTAVYVTQKHDNLWILTETNPLVPIEVKVKREPPSVILQQSSQTLQVGSTALNKKVFVTGGTTDQHESRTGRVYISFRQGLAHQAWWKDHCMCRVPLYPLRWTHTHPKLARDDHMLANI